MVSAKLMVIHTHVSAQADTQETIVNLLTHVQIINVRMELLHKQMVIHVHALAHHFTLEPIVRLT